jgi:hypothetical protein
MNGYAMFRVVHAVGESRKQTTKPQDNRQTLQRHESVSRSFVHRAPLFRISLYSQRLT